MSREADTLAAVGHFDDETALGGDGSLIIAPNWNIGESANGGYAMAPVLRSIRDLGAHSDPISVTTHFLRPTTGGDVARVRSETIRNGRTTSVGRGTLDQSDKDRLTVTAVFGDLSTPSPVGSEIAVPAPDIPGPDDCVDRSQLEQGVALPILERVDVRIHPDRAVAGESSDAVVEGWIRFIDGTPPSALSVPLFADAFPPSLFSKLGRVGWVPTIELTVHLRRRPAPGWIQARFECDDLAGGRMIETGSLWDETGALVARSRQIGLLRPA